MVMHNRTSKRQNCLWTCLFDLFIFLGIYETVKKTCRISPAILMRTIRIKSFGEYPEILHIFLYKSVRLKLKYSSNLLTKNVESLTFS